MIKLFTTTSIDHHLQNSRCSRHQLTTLITMVWLILLLPLVAPQPIFAKSKKPNILIILADDMGFSDVGCYGGEIKTPNLDKLAKDGLRFTQFYNTARCWPTRAALLTGYYAQQVRRDTLPFAKLRGQGKRPPWAILLPQMLKPQGYRSYISGKWHIDSRPMLCGFDRSYRINDHDRFFTPKVHFEDGKRLPAVKPDSGFYLTTAIADHTLRCLKEHAKDHADQPFFQYMAFTCPHFPLHAMQKDIDKYRGRFSNGWDELRKLRLERIKKLGIVDCELSQRDSAAKAWDTLTANEQKQWQARMEVHAAMVDRMDQEIGRVLDQLRKMKAFDNTLILFLSDNGASAERILRGDGHDPTAPAGSRKTFLCIETGWANLANTPFRRYKMWNHEGGISTPLIAHWPQGIKAKGELRRNVGHVIDLVPTVLELTGSKVPKKINGVKVPDPPGHSLVPVFKKDNSVARDFLYWYHAGNRGYRIGDWKIVSEGKTGKWELYNLKTDRSEMKNLANKHPNKVKQMAAAWTKRSQQFQQTATGGTKKK